jgi:acetyl esterase/lipase
MRCNHQWPFIPRQSRGLSACALQLIAAAIAFWAIDATPALGQRAILKDGRELEGKFTQIPKIAEDPLKNADPEALTPILLCDDELRRTMVPVSRLAKIEQRAFASLEVIRVPQPVADEGNRISGVGPILGVTQFDEYGRRIFSMNTGRGRVDIVQGITEISPVYTKVRGLRGTTPYIIDMRIATSSIPRDVLATILKKVIDPKNVDHRLRLVRLLMQAERYHDAEAELRLVMADFPAEPAPKELIPDLRQVAARIVLREILARKAAGQHALAYALLKSFPAEGVAGATLEQVRQELEEYTNLERQRIEVIKRLRALVGEVSPGLQKTYTDAIKEIEAELSLNTLDRMAAFRRLEKDADLTAEQKLAIAISGWLVGADHAETNSKVALSLLEMRNLVRGYLNEAAAAQRDALFQKISQQESASPELIARLIARMKPPVESLPSTTSDYYELEAPGPPEGANASYFILLPPGYDPYRAYPAIVTLNGAGTSPVQQIDWWAGAASDKGRLGQATRQGYIVIAPAWTRPHQNKYNASAEEHDSVLRSLRDACRRFAIDTDRVYLSGHSMGGDAAWDIGVSHPDLWAGIIPIVATTTKASINHYTANAAALPMYFVAGELDGTRIQENSIDWDRYFVRNYDVTVVEYRGRGHEHFSDEILRLFDWMGRKRREFFPKEFTSATKRPWDNYFWWIETEGLSTPAPRGQALQVKGSITANNSVNIRAPGSASVWLAPEMIDFKRPINVVINGRSINQRLIQPDLRVLLDDVRTRGERAHPFWAKVEAEGR